MRPELENIALVEQYLEGNLSGQELTDFESKMVIDSDLKSEVDFQRVIMEAAVTSGRAQISEELDRVYQGTQVSDGFNWGSAKGYIMGVAAAGDIAGGVYYMNQDKPGDMDPIPVEQSNEVAPEKILNEEISEDKDNSSIEVVNENASEITLEILEPAGDDMMYMFDKGRLSLYGNFNSEKIRVEELFNNGKYYLHYEGSLYILDPTTEKIKLKKETDPVILDMFD